MSETSLPVAAALAVRVYSEFVEMPGLQLTLPQAQRLFGLEPRQCAAVLESLVERRALILLPNGRYARPGVEARGYRVPPRYTGGELANSA